MPVIQRLIWTRRNDEHIARHGVTRFEVEELRWNAPLLTRAGEIRYRAIGVSDAGRYLTVFLDARNGGVYYVVTARDSTDSERRRYRAIRGRG